jgi:hypothetical protein
VVCDGWLVDGTPRPGVLSRRPVVWTA